MHPVPSLRILASGIARVAAVLTAIVLLGAIADFLVPPLVLPLGAWRWMGLPLLAAGLLLESAGTIAFWSQGRGTPHPAGAPQQLVRVGPFKHSRNPLYLARLMVLAGAAILLASGGTLLLTALLFLAIEFWLLPQEEARLRSRFGADYEEYCRTVPRWVALAHRRS